jgi:hypothetical protein
MIRNANIAQNAGISSSKIAGGIDGYFIPNNVRRVAQPESWTGGNYYRKIIDTMPSGMVYNELHLACADADEADVIYVHAGDAVYLSDAKSTITAPRVKLFGQQAHPGLWGSPSIHTHATDVICLDVVGNQCEIAGLGFHIQAANVGIQLGETSVVWRTYIHDCFFGGNATGTYGIDAGCTYDAPYTVIANCKFEDFATANVRLRAHHSMITNTLHVVYTAKIGVEYSDNAGDRPYGQILDNRFTTSDNTNAYGIKITNTPTAGLVFIDGNRFSYFHGNDHAISKVTLGYLGRNWLDDGTGADGSPIQIV